MGLIKLNKSKLELAIESGINAVFTMAIIIGTLVFIITVIHITCPNVEFFANIVGFFKY